MKKDMAGQRFGRLVVVKEIGCKYRHRTWECQCDCENKVIVRSDHLCSGDTKSCGCYKREVVIKKNMTHGCYNHPACRVWYGIKKRCYDPKDISYKDYGGRGITVCSEWKDNPKAFIEWAITNGWQPNLQIDRFDNDGNYSPDNCRFATRSEQMLNSRLLHSTNTSGFRGVSWDKRKKKYSASADIDNKTHYLGHFATAIKAAKARDAFVTKLGLHTPLNFPSLAFVL